MQLPQSKNKQLYIDQIKALETSLKEATTGGSDKALLSQVQKRLDTLAKKYQYDKELGAAKYKLYELQALVHYFNGNDYDALDFINQAIETRGDNYPRAEKLKAQLLAKSTHSPEIVDPENMTKQERRKKLIGLEGWLAFFVVGVSLSILLGVINLLGYGPVFSDLASLQSEASDYVAAMTSVLWFEILTNLLSIGLAVWLLILLVKHKRLAVNIAIVYLVSNAVLLIIDYAWTTSVFDTFGITQYVQAEMSRSAGDVGRGIIAAFIWVPYFLVSKRVRATLAK